MACEAVRGYVSARGWRPADVDRAVLSVSEATSNSVEHGAGDLRVGYALEDDVLVLDVMDGGAGPLRDQLARAALPEDPFAVGGRGLFILTALADSVAVLEDGRLRVTIRATP